MTDASESITDAVTHLHNLLQTKEKDLKEREEAFAKRVKLFETTNPSIGSGNDVIQLNVGGQKNIAVLRSLLTQFEDSMLAAKFSGRWDDSMEKDRDGNVFLDQDPESFMILISYLRLRMNNQLRRVPNCHRPSPTYRFCTMLEYYNMLPGVCPQTWHGNESLFDCKEIGYGTVTLTTKEGEHASVIHPHHGMSTPEFLEFTVEFDKGTSGAVGWLYCTDNGQSNKITSAFDEVTNRSMFLNIAHRKVYGPGEILEENMRIDHSESVLKVICQRSGSLGQRDFSITVADNAKVSASIDNSLPHEKVRILPVIHFSGKVTVSGIKYAIDECP
eukprot:scaffold101346_cov68-Cyclotella_meneghiniana.AAC.3